MVKLVIAEDNPFVVAIIREAVAEDPRYEICGIATSTPQLLSLGELHKPDLAVIDLRLADESSEIHTAVALSERIRVGILSRPGTRNKCLIHRRPLARLVSRSRSLVLN